MNAEQIMWYAGAVLLGAIASWLAFRTFSMRKSGEASAGNIGARIAAMLVLLAGSFFCFNASTALSGEDEAVVIESGGTNDLVANDDDFFGGDLDDFGEAPAGDNATGENTAVEAPAEGELATE